MAVLYPDFEQILKFKTKPTEGELHLLKFLSNNLDNSFEIYFNPQMNGDRPDFVIMRKGYGVMIIEVKDYYLKSYELDERKHWKVKNNSKAYFTSPVSQVLKYKDNLFDLHIEHLLEKKIKDIRHFNIVSCAVYLHNAYSSDIEDFLINPFKTDRKYMDFLKYNIYFIGRDNLNEFDLNKLLTKRYLKADKLSWLFTDDIYRSFQRFLKPTIHLKEQGKDYNYSEKQKELIYESNKKQQRVKGVVGSGKTTVLAARAVQAFKRSQGRVLILTYNITLKNYIRDKISDVREDFRMDSFTILNYHNFINAELNNLGIPISLPSDFDFWDEDRRSNFFETNYYSNKALFYDCKKDIVPYDVILIDEIQDYKRVWMEIIKECFLAEGGEYVLFGDVKQNIYNNKTEGKDVSTNVIGVSELKTCYRSEFKIKDLAIQFQKDFFKDKYEIDDFNQSPVQLEIGYKRDEGLVNYIYLPKADSITSLYTIIHENIINQNVPPNDITILANSISLLKTFDCYYRYLTNEKTNTMFETNEIIYRMGFNYLQNEHPDWLNEALILIKRDKDLNKTKAYNQLSVLFTLVDLYITYPEKFENKLDYYCTKYKTTTTDILNYYNSNKEQIEEFRKQQSSDKNSMLNKIRMNKKINFYMNSGTIKLSTVHSFKGWESEYLFLIMERKYSKMGISFDELLYTGITRSRSNLILINFGNELYHEKLKELVNKVK